MHVYSVKQFYSIIGSSIYFCFTLCAVIREGGRGQSQREEGRVAQPPRKGLVEMEGARGNGELDGVHVSVIPKVVSTQLYCNL